MIIVRCISCGESYPPSKAIYTCEKCGDLLEIQYDFDALKEKLDKSRWREKPLSVWKYRDFMPIGGESKIVTLNEGGTPLYRCLRIGEEIGMRNLYVKFEGTNPSGSFKDRGLTVGVTKALEMGTKATICASTGNTASSMAAYASRAGLKAFVVVPRGKVAMGKLAQARAYGAKVLMIPGDFDDALSLVIKLSSRSDLYLLNSINPFRLEGQRTAAFEIIDQFGEVPDWVILPVGNAGNISAYWKGFTEWRKLGLIDEVPRMLGVQAKGACPIASAVKQGRETVEFVDHPETIATAIRIGKPINWKKAIKAIRDSKGTAEVVSDDEILHAQRLLASKEGIFAEPASAASLAGLKKAVESGEIGVNDKVVCVATGCGLKDVEVIEKLYEKPVEVEPNLKDLMIAMGLTGEN